MALLTGQTEYYGTLPNKHPGTCSGLDGPVPSHYTLSSLSIHLHLNNLLDFRGLWSAMCETNKIHNVSVTAFLSSRISNQYAAALLFATSLLTVSVVRFCFVDLYILEGHPVLLHRPAVSCVQQNFQPLPVTSHCSSLQEICDNSPSPQVHHNHWP